MKLPTIRQLLRIAYTRGLPLRLSVDDVRRLWHEMNTKRRKK